MYVTSAQIRAAADTRLLRSGVEMKWEAPETGWIDHTTQPYCRLMLVNKCSPLYQQPLGGSSPLTPILSDNWLT